LKENGAPFDGDVTELAARENRQKVLIWLKENGFPWTKLTCAGAVGGGHAELLKWLREQGCPWDYRVLSVQVDNATTWLWNGRSRMDVLGMRGMNLIDGANLALFLFCVASDITLPITAPRKDSSC